MKRFLLISMLLGASVLGYAQEVIIGDEWDNYNEWDDYSTVYGSDQPCYTGSAGDHAPFALEYTYSGSQNIYTSSELADLAGHDITSLSFKVAVIGFIDVPSTINVKIYMSETNHSTPFVNASGKGVFYPIEGLEPVFNGEISIEDEYLWDYIYYNDCWAKELTFEIDPFYYSGKNNLLVTFIVESDGTETNGLDDFNFMTSGLAKRSIAFGSAKQSFETVFSGNRVTPLSNNHIIDAPAAAIGGTTGTPIPETWSSYIPTEDVDLDFAEGSLDAYAVTGTEGGKATLTRVVSAKEGTPLLLKKSITASIQTSNSATVPAGNLLKVSDGSVAGDGATIYGLAKQDGKVAFYQVAEGVVVPNGKVYLQLEEANTNSLITFDTTTGIEGMNTRATENADKAYYTLSGVRVANPSKGLYIHNGKKIIIK